MTILSDKQQEILFELVRCFIRSGNAVGSATLADSMSGEHKASTLRYNLGRLEESGYLRKAHASAGRLPTDKAYREYVRTIMDRTFLSGNEERRIRQALETVRVELKILIGRACDVMASHSDLMSVVVSPEPNLAEIGIVRLVPLSTTSLLVVIVTGTDTTHTRMVQLPIEITGLDLATLERSLNARLVGKRLYDIDENSLADAFNLADAHQFIILNIRRPVEEFLREMRFAEGGRLQVKGRERVVAGAEGNPEQIRGVLELLDDESRLLTLLKTIEGGQGVRALIGSDFTRSGLERVALVFSDFQTIGDSRGKIGVIGPRRMEYERIIPLVKLISEILEEKIGGKRLLIE